MVQTEPKNLPGGGMPVRVVVALLVALEARGVAAGVLAGRTEERHINTENSHRTAT
jgi:hypothetical protein